MTCQIPFSVKNKKHISGCCLLKISFRVLRVMEWHKGLREELQLCCAQTCKTEQDMHWHSHFYPVCAEWNLLPSLSGLVQYKGCVIGLYY